MVQSIKATADAVLDKAVNSTPGVPGVVAVATDRNANIYEGAFGFPEPDEHLASFRGFLTPFTVLPLNDPIMERFARVRRFGLKGR